MPFVPGWMEALRDRGGPFLEKALDFASWRGPAEYPGGAPGMRRLGELVDEFARDAEASEVDDARFVEGAGSLLALLLLGHVGLGGHRRSGERHRVALGRRGFFDPFAAVDAAIDARRPAKELARRVALAEAEAEGHGPIARVVLAFETSLAEHRPNLTITSQFELSLELEGGIEIDLTRVAEATEGAGEPAVRAAAEKIVRLLPGAGAPSTLSWDEAAPRLLPRLVAASFFEELDRAHGTRGSLFSRPLAGSIALALVLAYEGRARFLRADEVAAFGVEPEQVVHRALTNLAGRSERARFASVETDAGRILVARTGDGLDAARLLLPGLHDVLARELEPPFAVAVPHRDTLLACSAQDAGAVAFLRARAADDAARAPHRISAEPLVVRGAALDALDSP